MEKTFPESRTLLGLVSPFNLIKRLDIKTRFELNSLLRWYRGSNVSIYSGVFNFDIESSMNYREIVEKTVDPIFNLGIFMVQSITEQNNKITVYGSGPREIDFFTHDNSKKKIEKSNLFYKTTYFRHSNTDGLPSLEYFTLSNNDEGKIQQDGIKLSREKINMNVWRFKLREI